LDGVLPEPDTICDVIGTPFPVSGLDTVAAGTQSVLADMSQEDKEIFGAIQELSKNRIIPSPFSLGAAGNANGQCG